MNAGLVMQLLCSACVVVAAFLHCGFSPEAFGICAAVYLIMPFPPAATRINTNIHH